MGKYLDVQSDIFSIFASTAWTGENIRTYPSNFLASSTDNEFIRVTIIPSGESVNSLSVSGMLIVEIFSPANEGPKRSSEIADLVDKHFSRRTIQASGKTTQLFGSSLTPNGLDYANKSLIRSTLSFPFNHFRS
jgi:hypothetical protein